jgi:hypothetical protein
LKKTKLKGLFENLGCHTWKLRWRDKKKKKKSTNVKPDVITPHTLSFHIEAAKTISTTPRKQWSMWRANASKTRTNHLLFLLIFDFYWKTKLPPSQYNNNKENMFKIRNNPWKSIFFPGYFYYFTVLPEIKNLNIH